MGRTMSREGILKTIGHGILYAGAAIGASHLVLSTKAGALYGFHLIWVILLQIKLIKYELKVVLTNHLIASI